MPFIQQFFGLDSISETSTTETTVMRREFLAPFDRKRLKCFFFFGDFTFNRCPRGPFLAQSGFFLRVNKESFQND